MSFNHSHKRPKMPIAQPQCLCYYAMKRTFACDSNLLSIKIDQKIQFERLERRRVCVRVIIAYHFTFECNFEWMPHADIYPRKKTRLIYAFQKYTAYHSRYWRIIIDECLLTFNYFKTNTHRHTTENSSATMWLIILLIIITIIN